jgi:DNA-binding protein YbaB
MTNPMHERFEQAMAEFEAKKAAITDFQQNMATAETTVTSKNRAVSATVDGRGEISAIKFVTTSYRTMAPAELANLLVETIRAAQTEAREKTYGMVEGLLPNRLPLREALSGSVNFEEAMNQLTRTFTETEQRGTDRPGANGGGR